MHNRDPRKVFQDMERKKIGKNSRKVYEKWAESELDYDADRAKDLLNKVRVCH